jgi:heterodisulfide reductase subunit D
MASRTGAKQPTNGAPAEAVVEEWRNAAYNCFSSGHKFCREVCPVMQVTRDERHTPTAFHANVVAMDKGHLTIEDVAEDYVHCTMCGACELRCPNTLFTGDFYRFRQRTVDVVKAMRALAVKEGVHQENWKRWAELTDRWGNEPVLGWNIETSAAKVRAWATGLDIPTGGDTVLFADCEAAFYRPSVPRAVALLLQAAGIEFGLMNQQWCCGGPMWETGYVDVAHKMAEHNMIDWRKTDCLPRSARLHHDHRALPRARRELRRVRDRPWRRSRRRAHSRRKDPADDADRAHRHVPRSVPVEQAPR